MGLGYWLAQAGVWLFLLLRLPPGKTTVVILLLSDLGSRLVIAADAYGMPRRRIPPLSLLLGPLAFCLLPLVGYALFFDKEWSSVRKFTMSSPSMQPAIEPGDTFVCDCRKRKYEAGQVVMVRAPSGQTVIKRIVAIGGQTFAEHDESLWIDGVRLSTPWTQEIPRNEVSPIYVPLGSVFVVGDDFNNSTDSRAFGPIEEKNLIGQPIWILFSSSWERMGAEIR